MRTIIVGDVHGCRVELEALLDRVGFASGDRLVFVGDLVARGPDSLGVLDVARRTGALIVRGNHEQKLIDWRRAAKARALGKPSVDVLLGRMHREIAESLRPVDWTLIENAPLWFDLLEHGLRVVHAGVMPGTSFASLSPETLLHIRTVPSSAHDRTPVLWGARYDGPPHVVFGHNAAPGLQIHPWATGLDTGCVYGGRLTALVLAEKQKIPQPRAARARLLHSEPARRIWFAPAKPKGA